MRKKGLAILLFLAVWQFAATIINQRVLLVGPVTVGIQIGKMALKAETYRVIFLTFFQVLYGFLLALITGFALAFLSYKKQWIEILLWPYITIMKAVPAACFIILCLVWCRIQSVSVVVGFIMVMPVIYTSFLVGFQSVSKELLEVKKVFKVGRKETFFGLILPQLSQSIRNAFQTGIPMAFKSIIAAQVIATPNFSVGKMLYMAKIYLATEELLAWTVIIVGMSILLEKGMLSMVSWFLSHLESIAVSEKSAKKKGKNKKQKEEKVMGFDTHSHWSLRCENIEKSYGEKTVLKDISTQFQTEKMVCIMGKSGAGKTTFLRILEGLELADSGNILWEKTPKIAVCFQDNRLIEQFSAIGNIRLVNENLEPEKVLEAMQEIGIAKNQKVEKMSGGMKRRVAILRALLAESDCIFLDEPFSGLDVETKKSVICFLQKVHRKRPDTLILLTTHEKKDVEALEAELYFIPEESEKK